VIKTTKQTFRIKSKEGISPEELLGCLEDSWSEVEWTVGEVVENRLYSMDEIKNIINHWRQDQGFLLDAGSDIQELIGLFVTRGD
jgi:hypothetical protein